MSLSNFFELLLRSRIFSLTADLIFQFFVGEAWGERHSFYFICVLSKKRSSILDPYAGLPRRERAAYLIRPSERLHRWQRVALDRSFPAPLPSHGKPGLPGDSPKRDHPVVGAMVSAKRQA